MTIDANNSMGGSSSSNPYRNLDVSDPAQYQRGLNMAMAAGLDALMGNDANGSNSSTNPWDMTTSNPMSNMSVGVSTSAGASAGTSAGSSTGSSTGSISTDFTSQVLAQEIKKEEIQAQEGAQTLQAQQSVQDTVAANVQSADSQVRARGWSRLLSNIH